MKSNRYSKPLRTAILAAAILALLRSPCRAFDIPPEMDNALLQAMTDLYNMDVEKSEREFQETIQRFPEEPLPHLFYAGGLWWLAAEQFQNPSLRKFLKKKFEKEVSLTIQTAIAKSQRLGSETDEVCFCLGGAYGLSGRWKVLDGHWIKAYKDGKMGYAYLRKALALNPKLYDANLGLGIYDYYTDTLSGFFKKIAASLFLHGDKERGMEELRLASELGHFSSVEAKIFLVDVYGDDERNYSKALGIALDLRERYPSSPLFHYMEIVLRFNIKDDAGSAREAESFIDKIKTSTGTYTAQQMPLPALFLANVQIKRHAPEEAVKTLSEAILSAPDAPTSWLSYCYLRRAQAEDIMGRRDDAVQDYRRVLRFPNYRSSRKEAKLFLKTPCTLEAAVTSMENQ